MNRFFYIVLLLFIAFYSCEKIENSPYSEVKFEKKTPLPDGGRSSAASFVIGEHAFVVLGRNAVPKNECFQYSPKEDKWDEMAPFPGTARVNAAAAVVSDLAYVGLGFNAELKIYDEDSNLNDFWRYDPKSDSWSRLADFPAESTVKPICFAFEGKIYVGFGFTGYSFTNEMWMYNPENNSWTALPDSPVPPRSGGAACQNSEYLFFGTGFDTKTLSDWWRYDLKSSLWEEVKSIPGTGRVTATAFSVDERIFIAAGRYFRGEYTGGHLKDDLLEYDVDKNKWYYLGKISGGGRENAVSFVVGGRAFIGLGENENGVLDDLWEINF